MIDFEKKVKLRSFSILFAIISSVHVFCLEPQGPDDIFGIQNGVNQPVSSSKGVGMTIKQWTDATMEVVAAEIFDNQKIVDNIRIARTNSLLRQLGMIRHPCPHIALCRIVYKSRGRLSSFTPLFVFSSSLQHGVAGERFGDEIEEALTHLTLGISPYSGSPCRFAHSERAIGVYLEENLKKWSEIVKTSSFR